MKFIASFCDPVESEKIELGEIAPEKIINYFEKINWDEFLEKAKNAKLDDVYFHPSFEIKNIETKNGLSFSAVGEPNNFEFQIYFTRPKKTKIFFGLSEKIDENYLTGIKGQTKNDAIDCIKAFIKNDIDYLSNKIGV